MKNPRKWLGLLLLAAAMLLVAGGALLGSLPPVYGSTARITVPPEKPVAPAEQVGPWVSTWQEKLLAKVVLHPVIENLKLNETWGARAGTGPLSNEVVYRRLRGQIQVLEQLHDGVGATNGVCLLEIRVRNHVPEEAAAIANEIARVYRDQEQVRQRQANERGIHRLEDELTQTRDGQLRETLEQRLRAERAALAVSAGGVEIIDQAEVNPRPIDSDRAASMLSFGGGVLLALLGCGILLAGPQARGAAADERE